jgi:hypothetical protein
MKLIILSIVTINLATITLQAATDYDREFRTLSKEHDDAIAAAVNPIDQRYRAALEALIRRATAANDLETALRVKTALQDLPGPDAFNQLFHSKIGSSFTYHDIVANYSTAVTFNANGEFRRGDPVFGKWVITGSHLELTSLEKGKPYKTVYEISTFRNGVVEGRIMEGEWADRKVQLIFPNQENPKR